MSGPLGRWMMLEVVDSTQDQAAAQLQHGTDVGVVFAKDQVAGRGRFNRTWCSEPGASLTMSLVLRAYRDHPRPHLVGMACAAAAAGALGCRLRWPNDLTAATRKLGGLLTELRPDQEGRRTPIVGIGVNLEPSAYPPELAAQATNLREVSGASHEPIEVARRIVEAIEAMSPPWSWADLAPAWAELDETPGKRYRLPDGIEARAVEVGPNGELVCESGEGTVRVLAADALFGGTDDSAGGA